MGNWGRPGEIKTLSGTLSFSLLGIRRTPPSTNAIGVEAITDGTSNTAPHSERLLGLNGARSLVYPGKTSNSLRGSFPPARASVTINNPTPVTPTTLAFLAA